jgi:hypothetical protein
MATRAQSEPKGYPNKAKVNAVVQYARDAGLDVCSIKVSPDGSIQVFDARAFPAAPRDEWEAWEQAGKLG